MFNAAAALGLVALIGTSALVFMHDATQDRIIAQQRRAVLASLNQIIPITSYDNALHDDYIDLAPSGLIHPRHPIRVYRARLAGRDTGLIMQVTAPNGYNGDIRMLVGIDFDGRILGVRVTGHRETPGLGGDDIEVEKSDWVLGFDGRSLADPERDLWAVKADGGVYDQFTGATITPRAVVETVSQALDYFQLNRQSLFSQPAMIRQENDES
jgi:electron transport complex protein RnfG